MYKNKKYSIISMTLSIIGCLGFCAYFVLIFNNGNWFSPELIDDGKKLIEMFLFNLLALGFAGLNFVIIITGLVFGLKTRIEDKGNKLAGASLVIGIIGLVSAFTFAVVYFITKSDGFFEYFFKQ